MKHGGLPEALRNLDNLANRDGACGEGRHETTDAGPGKECRPYSFGFENFQNAEMSESAGATVPWSECYAWLIDSARAGLDLYRRSHGLSPSMQAGSRAQ